MTKSGEQIRFRFAGVWQPWMGGNEAENAANLDPNVVGRSHARRRPDFLRFAESRTLHRHAASPRTAQRSAQQVDDATTALSDSEPPVLKISYRCAAVQGDFRC